MTKKKIVLLQVNYTQTTQMAFGKHTDPNKVGNKFSKDNQPSPQAKSEGHKRKKALKDLADALISGERLKKCKVIADKVGIDLEDNEFTLDIAMTLKQIEKAFDEGDTRAYQASMDRFLGKPPQQINQVNSTINLNTTE